MEVGIGRFVHTIFSPLLEAIGFDSFTSITCNFVSIEAVAGFHIQEAVYLLTH